MAKPFECPDFTCYECGSALEPQPPHRIDVGYTTDYLPRWYCEAHKAEAVTP